MSRSFFPTSSAAGRRGVAIGAIPLLDELRELDTWYQRPHTRSKAANRSRSSVHGFPDLDFLFQIVSFARYLRERQVTGPRRARKITRRGCG
jgi:hypothetical protein